MKKKNLLVTAIAILGLATITFAQTVPSYVPTIGLEGWWPFTGNAIDSSGNGNDGTIYNATLTTDSMANPNSAYYFNGGSAIIVPSINLNTFNAITISVWVRANDITSTTYEDFIRQQIAGPATPDFIFAFQDNGTTLSFGLNTNTGGYTELDIPINAGNFTNGWHHLVAIYDGTAKSVYCDGILLGTESKSGNIVTTNPQCAFGAASQFAEFFIGKLDEIGIWHRALTIQEITNLYQHTNVGVNEIYIDNLFSVFPNPVVSQINVKSEAQLLGSVYNVYDNIGKVVLSGKINSENTVIELGNLSGGIYLFSVGENLKQTFKVIKE